MSAWFTKALSITTLVRIVISFGQISAADSTLQNPGRKTNGTFGSNGKRKYKPENTIEVIFVSKIKHYVTLHRLPGNGRQCTQSHQRIISKLNTGLGMLYYHQGKIALEPLPETMIDEGQTSPVLDVLLYDNQHKQTRVIIEVAHNNGAANDFKKMVRLMEENDYGVTEGFVYNYTNGTWLKYRKGVGQVFDRPSFSEELNLDLASLL